MTLTFGECEHRGDLGTYEDDLRACGAEVVDSRVDHDAEEGTVTVAFADRDAYRAFLAKFKETDSYEFC
ncbi:MAG TPA: hypothetical protein VMW52_11530 [Phycisphaerae bacterium]|nr:hypothetical protein [Phycisphaerae bacterium]